MNKVLFLPCLLVLSLIFSVATHSDDHDNFAMNNLNIEVVKILHLSTFLIPNLAYVIFTSGSTGSLTITEAGFDFESMVNAGEIRINGNATSVFADFAVDSSIGGQTTLSLIPEPGAYALLTGVCALSAIMLRRRERRA